MTGATWYDGTSHVPATRGRVELVSYTTAGGEVTWRWLVPLCDGQGNRLGYAEPTSKETE